MNGIIEGVAGNAIWNGLGAFARRIAGSQIEIDSPRPLEVLSDAKPLGPDVSYPVSGKLKRLPKGHEIWLLKEENDGRLWPQGFSRVKYDPDKRTWAGRIAGSGRKDVKIVVVVAPPTSQDYFRYFQALGEQQGYKFEPLKRLPPECKNQTFVQAYIP